MYEVNLSARSVGPFMELVGTDRVYAIMREAEALRGVLGSRAVWNINSTSIGGGVAEMLRPLSRYARGLGIHARWLVVEGPPEFFRITKRLHNALHGARGDGSCLGRKQAVLYDRVMHQNFVALDTLVRPNDVVICHDPQTAGLVPHLIKLGARVVWRCHIGHERHDEEVDYGWAFLRPYLEHVPIAVFSRRAYAPAWLDARRAVVLTPSIDPFSAKNQEMDEATARAILSEVGLIDAPPSPGTPIFLRDDGSIGCADQPAEVVRLGRAPSWDTPLVTQVSRWDRMKDPLGVLQGFARIITPDVPGGPQLVLAGPNVRALADDPEGADVFAEVEGAWRDLPASLRRFVHLAALPMDDIEENAAIVNALQRHSAVVVQKSLQEGFGLTVTEAMWKRRPVVASAVGGIQDQIRDGVDGLLVHNPADLDEFARVLTRVLEDHALARRLGAAGHQHVREHFLSITALENWAKLVGQLVS